MNYSISIMSGKIKLKWFTKYSYFQFLEQVFKQSTIIQHFIQISAFINFCYKLIGQVGRQQQLISQYQVHFDTQCKRLIINVFVNKYLYLSIITLQIQEIFNLSKSKQDESSQSFDAIIIILMKKLIESDSLQYMPQIEINSLQKYEIQSKVKSNLQQNQKGPSQCDYGSLNQYKLDDLINLQADGFSQSTVIRLAYIENHSIHLQETAIQIFEKYAKNQLAFMAIYGKSQSGKSLLLDKLINLTEVEGSNFTRIQQQFKGIYLWSIPFSRNNTKIFLADINGYESAQIDEDYLILLSFLLFISSSLVLLSSPNDLPFEELNTIYKHLKKCRKYFICEDSAQFDIIWPQNLYCLFRSSVSGSKTIDSLRGIFKSFNFKVISNAMQQKYAKEFKDSDLKNISLKKYNQRKKILNQSYICRTSGLFRHVYGKINFKSVMNLRFTGANLIKLVINAVQSLNVKGHLNIDKIFQRSMKELYNDAYNFHTQLYNQHLATFLNDEKPFQVDYLIHAFKDTHEFIFKSFNHLTISPDLRKTYSQKLQKYVNQKEKMILAINKKKSANQVKQVVPKVKPQAIQINEFIKEAKASPKYLEQVYPLEISPYITTAIKDVESKRKKIEQKEVNTKQQIIYSKIKQKQSQLKQLKRNKLKESSSIKENITRKQFLDSKQKQLNQVAKKLKNSLQQIKLSEQQKKGQKLKTSNEQLKLQQQKLKRQIKMKQKMIVQLKSQTQVVRSNEHIELLASQIQQKVMKQRELQSALASNIPKLQSIQTFKSGSKIINPRKVQSRAYKSQNPHIRVISSQKNG